MPIYLKNVARKMNEQNTPAVTREGMGFTVRQTAVGTYQVEMFRNGIWYDGYISGRYHNVKDYFRKKYGIGIPLRKELDMAKGMNGTKVSYVHREQDGAFVNGR